MAGTSPKADSVTSLAGNVFQMEEMEVARFDLDILNVDGRAAREVVVPRLISARIISAFVAMALGLTILNMVGFGPNDFIHAAAHDVRHSAGFPCH
jgi:cobalt transporter subunit CbtB